MDQLVQGDMGAEEWGYSETLMSEEAEACFVLRLCERRLLISFARRNTRSTDVELGSTDDGGDHTILAISAKFGDWYLRILGEPCR